MADAGLRVDLAGLLGERILREVEYARFPPVHERHIPTYGALLWPDRETVDVADLGGVVFSVGGASPDTLRRLADGRQSFVMRRGAGVELVLLATPHDREDEVVRLRQRCGAGMVAVQRISDGGVRLFAHGSLAIWDGTRWWEKPYARSYAQSVARSVTYGSRSALAAVLDFCVHSLSPAPTGATMVWILDATDWRELAGVHPGVRLVPAPLLPLQDPLTYGAIRQLLTQTDGAALLTADARLAAVGAHLRSTPRAQELVQVDTAHGTRHASAQRFSFDQEQTMVFVVSEDGPVTVYSDGAAVASIRSRPDDAARSDPDEEQDEPRPGVEAFDCARCGKHFAAERLVGRSGAGGGVASARCPVCGAEHPGRHPLVPGRVWVTKRMAGT